MGRILVIDDERDVCDMLRDMLTGAGHRVDAAYDGQEGIDRFRASPHDLVLTDIFMPGKEGIATIRELREASSNVPIVVLSGGGAPRGSLDLSARIDYLEVAERLGASRVLRKPVEWEELVDTVSELLGAPSP